MFAGMGLLFIFAVTDVGVRMLDIGYLDPVAWSVRVPLFAGVSRTTNLIKTIALF